MGLPDVFQGLAMLEDQSGVKIIIGCGQTFLSEQFVNALAAPCIAFAQLPLFRGILGWMVFAFFIMALTYSSLISSHC